MGRQLPHQEFWLEVRSLVADGVSYVHARAIGEKNGYAKIEDNATTQDSEDPAVDASNAAKPSVQRQSNRPAEASIEKATTSVKEVRDATVHSSQQKIKVVPATTNNSPGQPQQNQASNGDDGDDHDHDELVE